MTGEVAVCPVWTGQGGVRGHCAEGDWRQDGPCLNQHTTTKVCLRLCLCSKGISIDWDTERAHCFPCCAFSSLLFSRQLCSHARFSCRLSGASPCSITPMQQLASRVPPSIELNISFDLATTSLNKERSTVGVRGAGI